MTTEELYQQLNKKKPTDKIWEFYYRYIDRRILRIERPKRMGWNWYKFAYRLSLGGLAVVYLFFVIVFVL